MNDYLVKENILVNMAEGVRKVTGLKKSLTLVEMA